MGGLWPDRPRMLISYAYPRTLDLALTKGMDLLVDSGAFTAHASGKRIDLADYADLLNRHHHQITAAFNLDVIGDWKASARNYERLRSAVHPDVSVIPVWHTTSPIRELERMCDEYDYVGIGGAANHASRPKLLMRIFIQAHQIARRHNTHLHGLGITGSVTLNRLPWYSADSSSWQSAQQYGRLPLATKDGRLETIRFSHPLTYEQRRLVRVYGGDPDLVAAGGFAQVSAVGERAVADRTWANRAAARSVMYLEHLHRRRHTTPFHLHLATTAQHSVNDTTPAWEMGSPW